MRIRRQTVEGLFIAIIIVGSYIVTHSSNIVGR